MAKRKRTEKTAWAVLHSELFNIIDRMRPMKSYREYLYYYYFGSIHDLRRSCIKIINTIDSMTEEEREQ